MWRVDWFRQLAAAGVTEFSTKFVGLLILYLVIGMFNIVRIVSGFKMIKYYNSKRAMLYIFPCAICMVFGIILAAAFNDEILITGQEKLYEAELPLGIIMIIVNLIFGSIGVRVFRRGDVDNIL